MNLKELKKRARGKAGLYYTAFRLSERGWNVSAQKNGLYAPNILVCESLDGTRKISVQVRSFEDRASVQISQGGLECNYWVIVHALASGKPETYILLDDEIRNNLKRNAGGSAVWLDEKFKYYEDNQFKEKWERIGSGFPYEVMSSREKKMKRLVILSCSQRKVQGKRKMCAMDRYDGPAYKVVRKYLRAVPDARTYDEFRILSAEFGLISDSLRIPYYDRRMTVERARELHKQTLDALKTILSSDRYDAVFVYMGKTYRCAIEGVDAFFPNIQYSHGRIGVQLSQLRQFLYNEE